MARRLELVCALASAIAGAVALGILLFAPINGTNPATDVSRNYSFFDQGLSPFDVLFFGVLVLLYVCVVLGALVHTLRRATGGLWLLRISGILLVPASIATGQIGLYFFGWAALLGLAAVIVSFVSARSSLAGAH